MSYFALLNDLQVAEIAGNDAGEFLANQFASDLAQIGDGEIQQSAWCDPKGRVLFAPLVFKFNGNYRCLISRDLADKFCRRLTMFVLRSNVSIELLDDTHVGGIQLDEATSIEDLTKLIDEFDLSLFEFKLGPSAAISPNRYYLIGRGDELTLFESRSSLTLHDTHWRRDQIVLGHAEINAALSGQFLPQNLNFDALDAVSFKKGCYPGQEIIARLKYRGTVKQRLYCLTSAEPVPENHTINALDGVFAFDDNTKKVGTVLSALFDNGKLYVLAVLDVAFVGASGSQDGPMVTLSSAPHPLSISAPPYSIPA